MSTGHQLAEAGADAAVANAGNEWASEAYLALCYYAERNPTFLTDDVRVFAHDHGLPLPPDSRAWGGVVNRALRAKLIERVGFAPVKSASGHARPMTVWKWIGEPA